MRALSSSGRTTITAAVLARFVIASVSAAALFLATNAAHAAQDDETRTVGAITLLNRKAVEAYQELNFDEAQRLLRQALDLAEARGLSQHPIRARTYVNLGIVLVGGYKDREQAIKMFHQGLADLARDPAQPRDGQSPDSGGLRRGRPAPEQRARVLDAGAPADGRRRAAGREAPGSRSGSDRRCAATRSPSPSRRTSASANVP